MANCVLYNGSSRVEKGVMFDDEPISRERPGSMDYLVGKLLENSLLIRPEDLVAMEAIFWGVRSAFSGANL